MGDEVFNIANSFFSTLTSFSSESSAWWRGHTLSVTNGVTGYWIEGRFNTPFSVAAWLSIGYNTPSYLMGSNDGSSFTTISFTAAESAACATYVPCKYLVASLPPPPYSFYRVVTPESNYDYLVTLFQAPASTPPPTAAGWSYQGAFVDFTNGVRVLPYTANDAPGAVCYPDANSCSLAGNVGVAACEAWGLASGLNVIGVQYDGQASYVVQALTSRSSGRKKHSRIISVLRLFELQLRGARRHVVQRSERMRVLEPKYVPLRQPQNETRLVSPLHSRLTRVLAVYTLASLPTPVPSPPPPRAVPSSPPPPVVAPSPQPSSSPPPPRSSPPPSMSPAPPALTAVEDVSPNPVDLYAHTSSSGVCTPSGGGLYGSGTEGAYAGVYVAIPQSTTVSDKSVKKFAFNFLCVHALLHATKGLWLKLSLQTCPLTGRIPRSSGNNFIEYWIRRVAQNKGGENARA